MATREEAIAELYRRNLLNPEQKSAVEELARRGRLDLGPAFVMNQPKGGLPGVGKGAVAYEKQPAADIPAGEPAPLTFRQELMAEVAEDVGPLQSFAIGAGKGLANIGRGVGLMDQPDPAETEAMGALSEENPISTAAGEIVGEAAPFVIPGVAAGRIPSMAGRVLASGAVGGAEGGIIQKGRGEDVLSGVGLGSSIGMGGEVLFPVLGRLGRKIFGRVTGKAPKGAMLDAAGRPTPELDDALEAAGMSFDELTQDAVDVIASQKPWSVPGQVQTAALFAEEGIPATRGEITKDFGQLAEESRLIESVQDTAAEPLRQFKLKQSEAIKERLRSVGFDVETEETGQLIQDALSGRRSLLRTQKNELYEQASESAKEIGDVPIFTDGIREAVPDADLFEDLAITAPAGMKSLDQILTKYGLKEPTDEAIEAGFKPTPLTVDNFERFRKTLNAIERGDQTGAVKVATGSIKRALDDELIELGSVAGAEIPENVLKPLKEARKTVRTLKTEFSPQSTIGRIVDVKKDGVTQITEASKVYNKLVGKASPVEDTRKLMQSLNRSGEKGKQAVASLQASTIMDLIDAGFGTESRKISGVKTFNPIAFKRRLNTIGPEKMKALFANEAQTLKKINNIEKIAGELVPPSGAVPKGSASVILDLANNLGLAGISVKMPGGALLIGALKALSEPIKKGAAVKRAMQSTPDVAPIRGLIENNFPGIASAIAIPLTTEDKR